MRTLNNLLHCAVAVTLTLSQRAASFSTHPQFAASQRATTSTTTQQFMATEKKKTESGETRPWNVLRFVQQSSKFVPLPFSNAATSSSPRTVAPRDVLWSAATPNWNEFRLAPLDDVVMGGASSSFFDNASGIWRGTVTDANNGGFIGVRNTPYVAWDMSTCQGFELVVRQLPSDNGKASPRRKFKLGVRDATEFNGIVWNSSFDIPASSRGGSGKYIKVRIPLAKLIPTKFAGTVQGEERIRKDNIVGLQLVYSKFEYDGDLNPLFTIGDVAMQVQEIRAY